MMKDEPGGCPDDPLTITEQILLVKLARTALTAAVCEGRLLPLNLETLPTRLQAQGASFVTLTVRGALRGCVGTLEARQPLAQDVCEHAAAAALQDYRFPQVVSAELPEILIEISRLTPPCRVHYRCPEDLLTLLRPGVDGVVLRRGSQQATFLPQVWEKIGDPGLFLSLLCEKMNARRDLWRNRELQVYTYQVEKFYEGE